MKRLIKLVLIPFLVSACTESGAVTSGIEHSDSAGVELVQHAGAEAIAPPDARLEEALRIGTVSGSEEYQFFRLNAVAVDDDGTIFALDRGNRSVRAYDPQGQFLRSFGRGGQGPGEFMAPYGLVLRGDSVVVLDRLIHTFLRDGTLVTAVQPTLPERTFLWSLTIVGDDWLGEIRTPSSGPDGLVDGSRNELLAVTLDPTAMAPIDTVARIPGAPRYSLGPVGFILSPLFEPEPSLVLSPSGVYAVPSGAYVIDTYQPRIGLARRVSVGVAPAPITAELIDQYIKFEEERIDSRPTNPETAPLKEAMLELRPGLPMPEQRPVVGRVLVSSDGEMLVERLDLDTTPFEAVGDVTWDYFTRVGELSGRFSTPPTIQPLHLHDGSLWVVSRDELDVQYLVRYEVVLGTPPTA